MKKTLLIALSILCAFTSFSQAQTTKTLKGIVIDSVKNEPLSYVTITLLDAKTSAQLKSTLTKDNGGFELNAPQAGSYKIAVAFIGYRNKIVAVGAQTDLGKILISPEGKQLGEVSITATKPIVTQEVDRVSYNIQADPENKVLSVLDMLRKVPMVSVDAQDNIKLKGNTDYKILINGKESALIAKSPSDVFRAMPASNIERIEVITTPPAKYDGEGLAGIINIITKKNADQGYNGSINARYSNVYGPGANLNLTVKQGKVGLSGYLGYNRQNQQTTGFGNSNDIISPIVTNLVQTGNSTRKGNNLYSSAELSYEIDTLNLITGSFQNYHGNNSNGSDQTSTEVDGNNNLEQYYHQINNSTSAYNGTDLGINYQLGFKGNKDQLLTTSYKYSTSSNTQNTDAAYVANIGYDVPNYQQYNNSGTKEHTVQIDYVQPLKVITIEAGAKGIFRNNFSDFENYNQDSKTGEYLIDNTQTNTFNYQQNIYSLYNSYQLKLKKWVAKGGLRYEMTTVNADFSSVGSTTDQTYNNFIPSLSLQRVLNATNNITFGYTERISRPGIWQLNPFVDKSDPKFVNVGNPNLVPVTNHTFELNYSNFSKGSINVSLNYAFANNTVQNVLNVNPADTVTTTTYQNVGKNKRLGLDINSNYPITKALNININAELLHAWLAGTYNGQYYDAKGFQGHIFTYTSYKFTNGYNLGLNIGYDSRYVLLQGRDNDYFFYSLSAQKDILKKKATVSLYVNNPFEQYKKLDYFSNTPQFNQSNYNYVNARQIGISFNYKFGKLNSEIKKNQRGISNDDQSHGGH